MIPPRLLIPILIGSILLAGATPAHDGKPRKAAPVEYRSFRGELLTLQPWEGRNVAFLTSRGDLDRATMALLTRTFDRVYDFYHEFTGMKPTKDAATTYQGRDTIATVADTCGAGCSYLGFTGIEIIPEFFDILYDGVVQRHEYDHVLFYEFGRNFWFYGDKIEYKGDDDTGAVTTGYAVFMQFLAIDAAGVHAGPLNGLPFGEVRKVVEGVIDQYLADPSLNFENTLLVNVAPENPVGSDGPVLFASFLLRLRRDHGGNEFIRRLLREVRDRPDAQTTQDAVDNFVIAASQAAKKDLSGLFLKWRWPVSAAARHELARKRFP